MLNIYSLCNKHCVGTIYNLSTYVCDRSRGAHKTFIHPLLFLKLGVTKGTVSSVHYNKGIRVYHDPLPSPFPFEIVSNTKRIILPSLSWCSNFFCNVLWCHYVLGFYISLLDGERHEPQVSLNNKGKPFIVQG